MEPSKKYVSKSRAVKNLSVKKPCVLCNQIDPENVNISANSVLEHVAITSSILPSICADYYDDITYNLTNYCFYDKYGHLCKLDSGMIEKNIELYATGYIKPIFEHNPNIENGITVSNLGPILEWSISSFDNGAKVVLGITTEYANYMLVQPHVSFTNYMKSMFEKIHVSHYIIEFLLDSVEDDLSYEDILTHIECCINPTTNNTFSEEDLLTHAQFVVDQVIEYDFGETHILPLAETQCIETLIELSGAVKPVTSRKPNKSKSKMRKGVKINTKKQFSKATTTELVKDVFENMFAAQLDNQNETFTNSNSDDLENVGKQNKSFDTINIKECNNFCEKMFVGVKCKNSAITLIGQIQYLYKTGSLNKAHIVLFIRSTDTILGEAGDPQELFVLKKCVDIEIHNIFEKYTVVQKTPNDKWFNLGNSKLQNLTEPVDRNDKNSFFYQLQYDEEFGRFEYPKPRYNVNINECCNCEDKKLEDISNKPELCDFIKKENEISYFSKFNLHNEMYKIGSFIYLEPGVFSRSARLNMVDKQPFVHKESNKHNVVRKNIDQNKYPESYRKTQDNKMRGSNEATPNPFEIAEILAIHLHNNDLKKLEIAVRRMYRAEQIPLENYKNLDMNLLYWSEEQFTIRYEDICGKCFVAYIVNIIDPFIWSLAGPDRFYFTKMYNFITGSLIPDYRLPSEAKLTGKEVYVNYEHKYVDANKLQYIPSYEKIKPLRGLDIFAGCGGLTRGLEDSGLVKTEWAIENDENAAAAFKLNYATATVHVDNCNDLLQSIMSGIKTNSRNQKLPQKGEVEFICGGPPCQGFSGMNRFNSGQYSIFKNSLVVTFLSYIDYYRPKYFIMENVRNFVSFKKSMVLKLTLRCLTRMGYQCSFGILQAGNFGVPQTRRRLVIMGAAPNECLPFYPEPIHVFNRTFSTLSVQIGDKKFTTNCKYTYSAPMRTVTIYDAWSDLPEIVNGATQEKMLYKQDPITHSQKLFRYPNNRFSNSILTDHICKNMSPLVQARMELIPIGEGSDWRDLPNIEVKLSNSIITNKLQYTHDDLKNGKGPRGTLRGVCPCATGKKCNSEYRQNNTLIPWCLPHTGNRHNNWAGLYGRLAWSGYCSTTITNPEPMGKQGRVLHPGQHRVVGVRECARSQGFRDDFKFVGPLLDKHRQIGNAVPPPMGKAIGHEIIKAIKKNKQY